jgi:hypothetical protein
LRDDRNLQMVKEMHHYWRLRDGKVACFRGREDTALTAQVFGL